MKIGPVEKILIALSVLVVLGSFAFAINAVPKPDSVVVLKTLNMTCGSCAKTIEKTLLGKPGVGEVSVDVAAAQVVVIYDARITNPETLAAAVTAAGYQSGIVQSLSLERFREITGRSGSEKTPQKRAAAARNAADRHKGADQCVDLKQPGSVSMVSSFWPCCLLPVRLSRSACPASAARRR